VGAGYTYSVNGTTYQSGVTVSALASGSYNVTAKSGDGCVSAATVAVITAVPATPAAPVVGAITQPTCKVVTGSVVLSGLPAGNWTINPGGITGSTTSKTIAGLIPGTYQFTVTTAAGCISLPSASVKIDDAPVLTVTAGDDAEICAGSGTTLSATTNVPAYISWTPADGLSNIAIPNPVASPLVTTTYTVTATIPATNLITNPGFESGYAGFTSQYTQVAATNYYNGTNTSGLIPEGTYIVTGNPYSGYPGAPQGYHNDFNEAPRSGTSQLVVNGFTTSGKVVWSTTIPVFPNSDMTFSFWHVKLNHGADANLRVRINNVNDPSPVVIASDTYTKATRTLNTGTATSLTISLVDDNTVAGGNDFAIDDVSLTYDCPGTATDQVKVSVYTIAEPVVTVVQPTCAVATGSITVTAPVGTGVQYSLDGGAYTSTATFGLLKPGTYSVTAKSAEGCISTPKSVVINAQPATPAAPALALKQPACGETTGTITVTSPLGDLMYSINGTDYQASPVFTGLLPGTYTVTVKNTQCVSAATPAVINKGGVIPNVQAGPDMVIGCSIQQVTLEGSSTSEGVTFAWVASNGGHIVSGADTPKPLVNAAGTYTLTVTDKASGCSATDVALVTGGGLPPVLELMDAYCVFLNKEGKWTINAQEIATITAGSHAWKGTWQDLTFSFSKRTFECKDAVHSPVEVMVTATDIGGCTTSGMFLMEVLDTISPVAKCHSISVELDATGSVMVAPGLVNDGGDRANVPEWAKYFENLEGGSYDNCGIAEMYLDKMIFTRDDVGVNPVILTVIDPSGNTAECMATITVTDPFAIDVEQPGEVANTAPTLDDITDIEVVKEPLAFDVALTNITAGTEASQLVVVTATTDNTSLIGNLQVVYQAGSSTGKLMVTVAPGVSGEATVFVTVKDNGGILNGGMDTTVKSFKVKITAGEEEVVVEITNPDGTPVITSSIGLTSPFSFELYPNPTQDRVNIEMKGLKAQDTEVRVFSILGTEVYRKMYKSANLITLDLSPYVSGVYVVQLRTGNESFLRKVVLEK